MTTSTTLRHLAATLAAVIAVGASASTAAAQTRLWTVCGGSQGSGFDLCAAVHVIVEGTQTTVRVRNLSGVQGGTDARHVITSVGFDNVAAWINADAADVAITGPVRAGDDLTGATWSVFNNVTLGGGVNADFGGDNGSGSKRGIASSCALAGTLPGGSNNLFMTANPDCAGHAVTGADVNGGWVQFQFRTNAAWDPNAAGTGLFLKAQNGVRGGAECNTLTNCAPVSTVPEPSTYAMMGVGLVGLVAVARRRRAQG